MVVCKIKLMPVLLAAVRHPPHYIWGLGLDEWASLFAIIGGLVGLVFWLARWVIINPMKTSNDILSNTIKELSERVEGIGGNADKVHRDHDQQLKQHDIHLARHDEEIKTLFNKVGGDNEKD